MKLLVTFAVAALAAEESDRWSFTDYSVPDDLSTYGGKIGAATSGAYGSFTLTAEGYNIDGNGRYCHSTKDTVHIYRWDVSKYGYFQHFNQVQCVGEELYCFIEERAHFGQIMGIRAGCAQMMNHPQVDRYDQDNSSYANKPFISPVYNQEGGRGHTFQDIVPRGPVHIYYGIGGCLSMPSQNGRDHLAPDFQTSMRNNYYHENHGGWYQNQCLRIFEANGNSDLLPFGVSVCRSCCVATYAEDAYVSSTSRGLCNFIPYKETSTPTPKIPDATAFACYAGNAFSMTACDAAPGVNSCDFCTKQMSPILTMYTTTAGTTNYDDSYNLFAYNHVLGTETAATAPCASGVCTPTLVKMQPMA